MPGLDYEGKFALAVEANARMKEGRSGYAGQALRSMRRSWDYGEGKKNALKAGITLGVAGVAAGVGAATMGVGVPVVIALAAGTFLIGEMTDTAFAKFWGRKYVGAQRTEGWLKTADPVDPGQAKFLEERAHKTVRRAFQHYRTAHEKWGRFTMLNGPTKMKDLNEVDDLIRAMLHVRHHLNKVRLYIFPAIYFSLHVLEYSNDSCDQWGKADRRVLDGDWHPSQNCRCDNCYLNKDWFKKPNAGGRPIFEPLIDATEEIRRLTDLRERL